MHPFETRGIRDELTGWLRGHDEELLQGAQD